MVTAMTPVVCLLTAVLTVRMHPAIGHIELSPVQPRVNGSVTFIVTGIQGRILYSEWYRGYDANAANQIFRFKEGFPQIKGNRYFKEATGFANGSMQIVNLRKEFEGPYTVEIQTDALLQYTVQLVISDVEITGEGEENTVPSVPHENKQLHLMVQNMEQSLRYQNKLVTVMERIENNLVTIIDALHDLTGLVKKVNSEQKKHCTE